MMSSLEIQFLGAARQVTGSSYLLRAAGSNLLIDCGIYQERSLVERNWRTFPFPPENIDTVLLTHAHLDHSGLLPKLVREGFKGRILTTSATADILGIALMDSARIQEEDAALKKKRHVSEGRKGPHPEVPLYTMDDVARTMSLVEEVQYNEEIRVSDAVTVRFREAGHILGSAMLEITFSPGQGSSPKTIVFSGDIGQVDKPFVCDPYVFKSADHVIMESTYGDRDHLDPEPPEELLGRIVGETAAAGGITIIPTFAIERAQDLLFYLNRHVRHGRLNGIPVYLDSPMAREVTGVFAKHVEYFDEESSALLRAGENPFSFPGFKIIRTSEESRALSSLRGPAVIMAGSGMCTGGRVKHHLLNNLSKPETTVLFAGFQASNTLGRRILEGEKSVRIHGQEVPVKARIAIINGFSAHADRMGLSNWLRGIQTPPKTVFVCHGEEDVAVGFAEHIRETTGWTARAPRYLESIVLD